MARLTLSAPAVRSALSTITDTGATLNVYRFAGGVAVDVDRRAASFAADTLRSAGYAVKVLDSADWERTARLTVTLR